MTSLISARPEWQSRMAETLRITEKRRQLNVQRAWFGGLPSWPRSAFALASAVLLIAAGWLGVRMLHPPSAEQLLAQAYTEHRTLEVRVPGAKYAPVRVERNTGGSHLDMPTSLLKAEALIGEQLKKRPGDPVWLQARARADLLEGDYESAIKSLQRAIENQPDSPQLLTDLGSAYFARAESADRALDYGNAIESLSKALARSPDDPIALFNRALADERMFLYTQAVDDWEHYLRLDPQGDWADEARKNLAAVKQKLEQRQKSLAEPLLNPAEILAGSADTVLENRIDGRIEEYLKLAVADWLPSAFPASGTEQPRAPLVALNYLAAVARERHSDLWLAEFLSHSTGEQFRLAVKALAASVRANEQGDYVEGRNAAHNAARLFRSSRNSAGEMRAQAEEVYSNHLLWEGERCMSLLRNLAGPLKRTSYTWLRAELSLEESNCADLIGDLGLYQAAIGKGTREARDHNYAGLFLRGSGFQSLAAASLGDASTACSLASRGLALFWSGQVDLMKGYNLYTDLDAAADTLRLPNLQVVLWREATSLIDRHPDVLLRAMAHRWYGNAAYLANVPDLARSEFAKASELFAASPQTAATMRDRMDAEVWLAQIEIRHGDVQRAATRLLNIKPILDRAPGFGPEIGFYSAEAELGIRRGDFAATESALRPAIFLAEWALSSFPSQSNRHQWAEQTRSAYRNAVEWKLRQGDVNSALELWEWYRGADVRARENESSLSMGTPGTTTPPDPRNAPPLFAPSYVVGRLPLLKDETVIAYGSFRDGIAVWAYDDRGIVSRWIPISSPQVKEMALRFQRLCGDPDSDLSTLQKTARSLYDLLIAPIGDRIVSARTVLFEPDDFLAAIPWEALVDSTGHYLAERVAVVVSPGLYRAMQLRPATPITSETPALIVSVPQATEESFPPLMDAQNEAEAVVSRFSSSRWLQGSSATLSGIRHAIGGASVFHFAGHAFSSPLRSGLVLDELVPETQHSRLLDPNSLAPAETDHLQLAVLSACSTATDAQLGVPGANSLAEALLTSGVPHVVASRWNVDSRETSEFMRQFYTRLLAGNDVASSLRSAELTSASRAASAHPYYWAAFELLGN